MREVNTGSLPNAKLKPTRSRVYTQEKRRKLALD